MSKTVDPKITEGRAFLRRLQDGMRVTKVVCTRAVKGKGGDAFVGMSVVAWNTVQEDGGQNLLHTGETEESPSNVSGLSLRDAATAAHLLGMQVDVVAHQNAAAGNVISHEYMVDAIRGIKHNYGLLLSEDVQAAVSGEAAKEGGRE